MVLGFIFLAIHDRIGEPPAWLNLTTVGLVVAAVLAALAAALTLAAMARFQRARLMLD
jgi:hypothetical protein